MENCYEEELSDKVKSKAKKQSDYAMQTAYILRQVLNVSLRQTEGFVKLIFKLIKIELLVFDYTTLLRRIIELFVKFVFQKPNGRIYLITDSTGIKVVREQIMNKS